jgi:hypothetical protein
MNIPLSVLIPAVLERDARRLYEKLMAQAEPFGAEVLVFLDNRKRSTGLKDQALLNAALGRYVMLVDDDDDVADDCVAAIAGVIDAQARGSTGPSPVFTGEVDVISFDSQATLNLHDDSPKNPFVVHTSLAFENEQLRAVSGQWVDIGRKPWQWCAWRRELAQSASFPDGYIDPDAYWLRQLWAKAKTEYHIDRVLHFYHYDNQKSLSNRGKPAVSPS